ncbi:hypothetical protein UA08_07413 [Talaromyces atroroseus]|uniref:Uncharacterized protein n=1 Tax=Talaromyces atroroseus TaxID=1441469 RepID=A0A225AEB2_TALAT|nr:hypothetical protein UA08_07413 [Talaromyces atroroseus]OKL57383.1 hypothetical protein UA08_07413 [Talaromyces atroroseus]
MDLNIPLFPLSLSICTAAFLSIRIKHYSAARESATCYFPEAAEGKVDGKTMPLSDYLSNP